MGILSGWSGDSVRARTGKEPVELHQELEIHIVALGGTAVSALDVMTVEIDTCSVKPSSALRFMHAQHGLPVRKTQTAPQSQVVKDH